MTAKNIETIVIKKSQARRLYNTATGQYTTLESLAAMARDSVDFQVLDVKTGEDITRLVLIQIILESESKQGQNLLPIAFLRQLIQFYGGTMQILVQCFLETSINTLTDFQKEFLQQTSDHSPKSTFDKRDATRTTSEPV